MLRALIVIAIPLALTACAGGGSDDGAKTAAAAPVQKTVLDDQLKAIQKAKDVQKTVDQQAKDTDKAIDDSGG